MTMATTGPTAPDQPAPTDGQTSCDAVWSVDPRTGERREQVAVLTAAGAVEAVCEAATAAVPALVAAGREGRARMLDAMADALETARDEVVAVADAETALGPVRLTGEVARTVFQLRLFAKVLREGSYLDVRIDHADPAAGPAPRPDLRRMLVPLGPVAVFSASNFPLAFSVPGGDTASALAAGCPVVVKAHEGHPATSLLCVHLLRAAAASVGLPADVVGVVMGREAGVTLVQDPRIRAVGFTGSVAGGRALHDLAKRRPDPIPFHGELGSINPVVVTSDALERVEDVATGLATSFTLGVGQFCTKPGLVLVPAGEVAERLCRALAERVTPLGGGVMLTERIRDGFVDGVHRRRQARGAVIAGHGAPTGDTRTAIPVALRVTAADALADPEILEECFGPLVMIVEYTGDEDLAAVLAGVPGSLTGTVQCGRVTEDGLSPAATRALDLLLPRVGRLLVNDWPTGVAVTWAQHHGGPWPATTEPGGTSVGTAAVSRWLRPVAFQNVPQSALPPELRDAEVDLPRRVDGVLRLPG